jgi:hypothetical protein
MHSYPILSGGALNQVAAEPIPSHGASCIAHRNVAVEQPRRQFDAGNDVACTGKTVAHETLRL